MPKAFIRQFHLTYPMLRDPGGQAKAKLGVTGFPEFFVLDRSGHVAALRARTRRPRLHAGHGAPAVWPSAHERARGPPLRPGWPLLAACGCAVGHRGPRASPRRRCPRTTELAMESKVMCQVCGVPLVLANSLEADRERAYMTTLVNRCDWCQPDRGRHGDPVRAGDPR